MEDVKRFKVFRNASNTRIFYLRPRPHQPEGEPNFLLRPGETVEALDAAEEKLLTTISLELRDVEKETPALANSIDALQKQLADERAKNAALAEANAQLTERVGTVSRVQGKKG